MRLLLVSGSTRGASTNSATLRTARELLEGDAEVILYEDIGALPHFNPDDDAEGAPPPAVAALRAQIAQADAVIFCTPEYAGTLPGSFKNLLDWTVGGAEMDGQPAAWVNVAAPGRGTGADATLRTVLGYVNASLPPSAGIRVQVPHGALGAEGTIADAATRDALDQALRTLIAELR
jgi:chromate reductase, NAD(P)H dehydrogenase (quinone)